MDKIKITGGLPLNGKIEVSGSKNSTLPIFISSLLTADRCEFSRVPALQDIHSATLLLEHLGVEIDRNREHGRIKLRATRISSTEAPYDLVRKMRASVLVLGPLLARCHRARVSLPGGCAIGARPINIHLNGLKEMGAEIEIDQGYVNASCKKLTGERIRLEYPSVGATENLLMAATLASGQTAIENCAKEPEIIDLAETLRLMGAEIVGEGTDTILVQGKDSLGGCSHEIMGDRIEAATFLTAAFITRGDVTVRGVAPEIIEAVLHKLEHAGAMIKRDNRSIRLVSDTRPKSTDICTLPYPGFPTDMQAQFMAVMCLADGISEIEETVFENRFMHIPELLRLGADISIRGNKAQVKGCQELIGAPLMATDLRASASLVLAGLAAKGETVINRVYHLDRGYEAMETKLRSLGARIERVRRQS